MRRMTISRFKGTEALIAAAVVAAAAPLSAQDSAVVQQPPLQQPPLQQPRVHVVSEGETLWTLAQLYLGDAYLWPDIYRLNTLVVEDPHWIFPGEELRLVPPDTVLVGLVPNPNEPLQVGDSVLIPVTDSVQLRNVDDPELENQVTEVLPPPPPPSTAGRTVFKRPNQDTRLGLTVNRPPPRRNSGRLRFYSSGYLTEDEQFPWAEVLGATDEPTLSTLTATSAATVYEQIDIRAPENATYHIGDSLMLSRLSRRVPNWGRIVLPTGIARVVAIEGRVVRAKIETQFERIADGQVALPIEPFRDRRGVNPVPIENGMRGSVIVTRNLHPVTGLYNVVFIDRGRVDGIVPGDEFEVIVDPGDSELPTTRIGLLQVTHVRQRSAAVVVMGLNGVGVRPGAVVRLIRKMP